MIAAGAAFAEVLTAAPVRTIASLSALVSLGLLGIAGRVSIVLAGLSPQLATDDALVDTGDPCGLLVDQPARRVRVGNRGRRHRHRGRRTERRH